MASAAVATVAVTVLLVAGLAIYLILIAANLARISSALVSVYGAVEGIADQVKPAPGVVGAIAEDVGAIQGALHGLIALATAAAVPAPAAAAPVVAPRARPVVGGSARRVSSGGGGPTLPPPVHRRH